MITTRYSVVIGNFTYIEFPVFKEIEKLRRHAVQKLMTFFRMIGLGTPKQINAAIGNKEDDDRIERLLRQIGVAISVSEEAITENIRETEEMQKRIIKDDGRTIYINMGDIATKVQGVHYHDPETAIRELLGVQGYQLLPKKPSEEHSVKKDGDTKVAQGPESTRKVEPIRESEPVQKLEPVQGPELAQEPDSSTETEPEDPKPVIEEGAEPEIGPDKVARVDYLLKRARECPLKVRRDKALLSDKKYLEDLLRYFPSVSYEIMKEYLFDNAISTVLIQVSVTKAGIKKVSVGNSKGKKLEGIIYERAAFIAWAGGDWEGYLKEALATAKKKEAETVAKLRQSRKDFVISPWRNKGVHTKDDTQGSDQKKDDHPSQDQATPEHAQKKRGRPPKSVSENMPPEPVTPETVSKTPNMRPNDGFKATIVVSTALYRSRIEELILHILNDMPFISLEGYEITPKE